MKHHPGIVKICLRLPLFAGFTLISHIIGIDRNMLWSLHLNNLKLAIMASVIYICTHRPNNVWLEEPTENDTDAQSTEERTKAKTVRVDTNSTLDVVDANPKPVEVPTNSKHSQYDSHAELVGAETGSNTLDDATDKKNIDSAPTKNSGELKQIIRQDFEYVGAFKSYALLVAFFMMWIDDVLHIGSIDADGQWRFTWLDRKIRTAVILRVNECAYKTWMWKKWIFSYAELIEEFGSWKIIVAENESSVTIKSSHQVWIQCSQRLLR